MKTKLPQGWAVVTFGEITNARMGKTILSKELRASGLPVFSASSNSEAWGYIEDESVVFQRGTIVISARGTIGFAKLPRFERFVSTQTTIAATPLQGVDPEYLTYQLSNVKWSEYTSTTAIPMLTIAAISKLPIKICSINEQRRIAKKIESLFAQIDKGETALRAAQSLLAAYRQSILREAFAGRLLPQSSTAAPASLESAAQLPHDWTRCKLGDVIPAPRPKIPADPNSALPYIGMNHIEPHSFRLNGKDNFANMKSAGSYFQDGDVLYGRLRPYLNKVHLASFEGVASSEFIVLPASKSFAGNFIKYLLHQERFVQFAMNRITGDRPRVKFNTIADFEFWLPPLAEQRRIAKKIDTLFAQADQLEEEIRNALELTSRSRQSILKEAFAGRLLPQNPKDEPASALLTRLRKPSTPKQRQRKSAP